MTARRRLVCSAVLATAAWARAGRASADDACTIHLTPADVSAAWVAAVADAQRSIDATATSARDCRAIEVVVTADGATLTFVTLDGREAVRTLESPGNLRPTVEALLVTLPADGATKSTKDPAAPIESAPPLAADTDVPVAPKPSPTIDTAAHVQLSASAGARMGFLRTFLGPSFGVDASVLLSHWELGVLGLWEPATSELSSKAPGGFRMSAIGAGAHVGRRESLGNVQPFYALALTVVTSDSTADASTGKTTSDPRIGVLAGVVWPARGRYRLRPQVQLDYNPTRHQQALVNQQLSPLPRWGLGLALGIEMEVL